MAVKRKSKREQGARRGMQSTDRSSLSKDMPVTVRDPLSRRITKKKNGQAFTSH